MTVETVTYIDDLNASYPVGTDPKSEGDNHIRNLKTGIKTTFPNITGAMTATQAELNLMDGVTATTAELNILDGVTATAAELNILDGVTSTAAEINILDGVTATAIEINKLAGASVTTADLTQISTNTSKLSGIEAGATADQTLADLGITSTAAELNYLDNASLTAADLTKLAALTATAAELNTVAETSGITATAAEVNAICDGRTLTSTDDKIDNFPAGTDMLFYQSSAPTGWTRNTTAVLNDHALRIMTSGTWVSGTQGTTAFSTQFAQAFGGENYTLLTADIPSHTHTILSWSPGGGAIRSQATQIGAQSGTQQSEATGSGGAHAHDVNLGVKYLDMIIASKD